MNAASIGNSGAARHFNARAQKWERIRIRADRALINDRPSGDVPMTTVTNVRIMVGANAYAIIKTDKGTHDVLLNRGRSAQKSLRESAEELRARAAKTIEQAQMMEEAAKWLDTDDRRHDTTSMWFNAQEPQP